MGPGADPGRPRTPQTAQTYPWSHFRSQESIAPAPGLFRGPEIVGTGQGGPQEGHDVAMLYNTESLVLESSKVCLLDSDQQRCLLIAVFVCRHSGSRLLIGTTHLESGMCDPVDLRAIQLRFVLSRMDAYHLPCSIVAGDYNLRQWEAERAKVWELKEHLPPTLSMRGLPAPLCPSLI